MRRTLFLLVVAGCTVPGCSFPTPSEQYACEITTDCASGRVCDRGFCVLGEAPADVLPDTIDARVIDCTELGSRHFDACMLPAPTGGLDLSMPGVYTYNTAAATLTDPGGNVSTPPNLVVPSGRVISIDALAISAGTTLRAVGAQPLIVASWGSITVGGTIEVTSVAVADGAGANPAGCAMHPPGVAQGNTNGAGGGGGGGFGGAGGRGGTGDDSTNGGLGGAPIAQPLLLGGCPGSRGGTADQIGGVGGSGGGAIQLTARLDITISGTVTAGGGGGKGAPLPGNAGGGGGGSGGMIGLEAPIVMVAATGVLAANGGGGGQGASQSALGATGVDGLASAIRATGGATLAAGGQGGLGSGGLTVVGGLGQGDAADGAGGGGGGAGFIAIKSPTRTLASTAVVSPAPQIVP